MTKLQRSMPQRALLSVSDKTGIVELATALSNQSVELISTGSTASVLRESGLVVQEVSAVTGFKEALDGRVKTLHPAIHGGILADRRKARHREELEGLGIRAIDWVVVNLYPFVETLASGASEDDLLEQIDIGGPAMVRAAAKNHHSVAVVVSPERYGDLMDALGEGGTTLALRRELAAEAFTHTARYDSAVSGWLTGGTTLSYHATKLRDLRYGENSHQNAGVFAGYAVNPGVASSEILQGKEMSYNNYVDADAAVAAVFDHEGPTVAIIKHQNPCGIATDESLVMAYRAAHACDPVSAFGGVIAANRDIDAEVAQSIVEIFTEVVVAPGFSDEARKIFSTKDTVRLVRLPPGFHPESTSWRHISGGVLVQDVDHHFAEPSTWKLVSGAAATPEVLKSLAFAWRSVRAVKSNAILLAQGRASVGIGMGQVNRVDSCSLAVARAGERSVGSVAASDAFFPFADGLQILLDAGVTAVVQPGGSVRDDDVIAAAAKAGVTMYMTGERHFFH
jgi:phosphoribosylaminoimidazolecarboxamide formyltransferase/IMP cyclohydrolase